MRNQTTDRRRARHLSNVGLLSGFLVMLLFFTASGYLSYWNTHRMRANAMQVTETHDVILTIHQLLAGLRDAETAQRGYVMTGRPEYLEPYNAALPQIDRHYERLNELTNKYPRQQERLRGSRPYIDIKLQELADTISVRRNQGFETALDIVLTDKGKSALDELRARFREMEQAERDRRTERLNDKERAYHVSMVSGMIAALLGILLTAAVASLLRRTNEQKRQQTWMAEGRLGLADAVTGEKRVEDLSEQALGFLAKYLGAQVGVCYVEGKHGFRRVGAYGVPNEAGTPDHFTRNDGLLGQVVKECRLLQLDNVPEGYVRFGSALGSSVPRHLIIAPTHHDEQVNGVIELGFQHPINPITVQLLEQLGEPLGIAMRSAKYRAELQDFLEETQRQAEELQAQSEELKVSNEELEEQSRALKESQSRLEQQQAELEQTNAQLEEQTQMLEHQRDDLSRANESVASKAQELERASQYKSDFLANMSHELRTPLNSSLILAKLLGDNASGNLTDEQVKYARTIQSSGNDLLVLINDILDLSKIEAGHMDVRAETVMIKSMLDALSRVFEPIASMRQLGFNVDIDNKAPQQLRTDRQRLEQILKNLLSNAFKFTDKGSVTLRVRAEGENSIAFSVHDTGIGIDEEHQESVFAAFRQADGTISRKYGGTGLGLSISRELARLLGGHITLASTMGEGSIFTLHLPLTYNAEQVAEHLRPALAVMAAAPPRLNKSEESKKVLPSASIPDDRGQLTGDKRTILIVEDDANFASILLDLGHQSDFQCLVAGTAEDALLLARQYLPSAVILDVGLPDHSGLSVLDRLKHDARTRHIPVHVVSAEDYSKTALAIGAVGYMLKPVKREELAAALKQLETRLDQRLRRVLIVEDDPVQRDSLARLLGTQDVETIAVGTAAECLKQLKQQTFDCMVLDLSLPDTSGYALLETLSREDNYAFPPVIVYTGRELKSDEEQQLRRYSKSIIIKGAKSPERLLDEVTLFLHQVVADLPAEQQRMLEKARNRDAALEGRRILVVEDDVRNVYALTSIFEPHGVKVQIARNGKEALQALEASLGNAGSRPDLVLMDVMMPEMDGITATRSIRQNKEWKKLPIIMLTAKAMRDDQERCLAAGANDYMAKPIDVEKLLSLVRVWMPR